MLTALIMVTIKIQLNKQTRLNNTALPPRINMAGQSPMLTETTMPPQIEIISK